VRPQEAGVSLEMVSGYLLLCMTAATLQAHVVSISTGEIRLDGPTAIYELRIPMYEVAHVSQPETALLDHIRFDEGHRTRASCHEEDGTYVCRAEYEFPGLHPNSLEVECTLYQVTVPNHIHLLTAMQGSNSDQIVFDKTITEGEARFHPPSRAERIAKESVAGTKKAVSAAGLLFLIALALAARSKGEAGALAAIFIASEWAALPLGVRIPVTFTARFFEAALALTVAYLALEILMLPDGGLRGLVVAVLGLFHGLSFAGFPATYLAGASAIQVILFALLAASALQIPKSWTRPVARTLLAAGLIWFGFGLWR
jgi:hypothetical protein